MMEDNLRQVQLAELELFKDFAKVCKKYNITYYALGGTLLGAVRHQGFIPWDDDMDLGIPREDYDRFLKIAKKRSMNIHTFFYDEDYFRYFARLENPSVQLIRYDKGKPEICSAWIDVFPLDGMPNNKLLRSLWKYYLLYRRAMYRFATIDTIKDVKNKHRPFAERILLKIGRIIPVQKIFSQDKELRKLDRALKRVPYARSDYLVNAMGEWKFKEMFHKKYYGKGRDYPFEDTVVRGPENYDFVCTQLYGDYMTPPKADQRNHHYTKTIHSER